MEVIFWILKLEGLYMNITSSFPRRWCLVCRVEIIVYRNFWNNLISCLCFVCFRPVSSILCNLLLFFLFPQCYVKYNSRNFCLVFSMLKLVWPFGSLLVVLVMGWLNSVPLWMKYSHPVAHDWNKCNTFIWADLDLLQINFYGGMI